MAEIINLRAARKAKQRAEGAAAAAQNRARFGRCKGAKRSEQAEAERRERQLEGARLEIGREEGDPPRE